MHRVSLVSLAAVIHFAASAATAQTPARPSPGEHVERIVFDGGSLAKYLDSVREHFKNANIVVEGPLATEVVLPKAPLQRVTLANAVHWIAGTNNAKAVGVSVNSYPSTRDSSAVFLITAPAAPKPVSDGDVVFTRLPSYPEMNRSLTPEMVQKAVRDVFHERGKDAPNIKYDPATQQIIVSGGSSMDRSMAMRLIEQRKLEARDDYSAALQTQIRNLRIENDSLRRQLAQIKKGS